MSFTVAIIGRPNVGKSTLFNRLTGRKTALVDDMPGLTRDRKEGEANLAGLTFKLLDTAGLEDAKPGSLQARMTAQSEQAMTEADAVLLVVDGRAGITPADKHFASRIRKLHKSVILVINKSESGKIASAVAESYTLGLGEPVAISAEHNEGFAELYERLAPFEDKLRVASCELQETEEISDSQLATRNSQLRIAIVGRPNAGKSTLFNRILGEERTLTGPEAGITRDAITADFEFEGHAMQLVDTAGMRKKSGITVKPEQMAVSDSLRAIRAAELVVLVIDANQPLEKQDNTIAALTEQEGRALVIAVNKWDTVVDKDAYLKAIEQRLAHVMPQSQGVPLVPLSAETGYNVPLLLKTCLKAHEVWNTELSTGQLNRWLETALQIHTPPLVKGRRIKIRYMTQKSSRPPSFILFANLSDIPDHYVRYLVNSMREHFSLPGTPIRIKIRKNKNPYDKG